MLGIAALCCLPILVWNAQHDWVTFQHVKRLAGLAPTEQSGHDRAVAALGWGRCQYLGGQAALLLGFWFVAWLRRHGRLQPAARARRRACASCGGCRRRCSCSFFAFSLKTGGGEPNWPVTAYLSGGVLAAAWLVGVPGSVQSALAALDDGGRAGRRSRLVGLAPDRGGPPQRLDASRCSTASPAPPTPERPFPVRRFDPTCRLRGWRTLAARVDEIRERLRDRGAASRCWRATAGACPASWASTATGMPPVYSVGLMQGDRHSQYDLLAGPDRRPEAFLGKTFIIVGGVGAAGDGGVRARRAGRSGCSTRRTAGRWRAGRSTSATGSRASARSRVPRAHDRRPVLLAARQRPAKPQAARGSPIATSYTC